MEERLVFGMNGTERIDVFQEKLKEDSVEYSGLETSEYSLEEKKNAIPSFMNICRPRELPDEHIISRSI